MEYSTLLGSSSEEASRWLKEGHLVAMPTETVYGLAGNALDPTVIVRIFETKERPLYNPLIVHVASVSEARQLVRVWPAELDRLTRTFWPGPLTILLPRQEIIPDLVTAGLDRVALRIPDHPLALELIRTCGFPLAAPSANLFSRISPTTAEHVQRQLDGRIPYILDGGPCTIGLESTIIGKENDFWTIYRQGAVTAPDLEAFLGRVRVIEEKAPVTAPGMLPLHYAPRTPLYFGDIDHTSLQLKKKKFGLLLFKQRRNTSAPQVVLAPDGEPRTAARYFYAALHQLDAMGLEAILAEPAPDQGLGRAINDRLQRAAANAA